MYTPTGYGQHPLQRCASLLPPSERPPHHGHHPVLIAAALCEYPRAISVCGRHVYHQPFIRGYYAQLQSAGDRSGEVVEDLGVFSPPHVIAPLAKECHQWFDVASEVRHELAGEIQSTKHLLELMLTSGQRTAEQLTHGFVPELQETLTQEKAEKY